MNLIKATIENYRSIKETTIKFEDGVTVLAGKNEAGKTSILKALYDMNHNKVISDEAKPIDLDDKEPKITIEVEYDLNEIEEIATFKEILEFLEILPNSSKKLTLKLTKHHLKEYSIFVKTGDSEEWNEINKIINEKISNLFEELKQQGLSLPDFDESQTQQLLQNLNVELNKPNNKEVKEKISEAIKRVQLLERFKKEKSNIIRQILPNFILFESFRDALPDKIPVSHAEGNEIVKDFFTAIGKLKILKQWMMYASDPQKFQKITSKVQEFSTEIFGNFLKEYEEFEIMVERGGNNYNDIWFLVKKQKNSPVSYKISQRSEGLRWWLSLNIRIKAKIEKDRTNILLIDEPSLYLHISAQKKAMERIFEMSKGNLQMIYATHSPYMIPAENLEKIRMVVKEDNGTKVKYAYESADKDTLTPILMALGANVLSGLSLDCESPPIVTEGIVDHIYLTWAMEKIKDELISQFREDSEKAKEITGKLRIIPAGGSDKTHDIGIILWYLGFRPFFIFDGDKKGEDSARRLKKHIDYSKNILLLNELNKDIKEIEDLFKEEIQKARENDDDLKKWTKIADKTTKIIIPKSAKVKVAKKVVSGIVDLSDGTKEKCMELFRKIIMWFQFKQLNKT